MDADKACTGRHFDFGDYCLGLRGVSVGGVRDG